MKFRRTATQTLTPVELFHGEAVEFKLLDGSVKLIELLDTGAEILQTTLKTPKAEEYGAMTSYRFWADVAINGKKHRLEREVGTQKSFYDPYVIDGVRIWLDAVDAIFEFMNETHGRCRPSATCSHTYFPYKHARFALQDATARICPEILYPWCQNCYRGDDCWMGAYDGSSAHGGLDINHPKGTPLHVPFDLDDQFLVRRVDDGYVNNSWRGTRRWTDGSEWSINTAHMTEVVVPDHTPVKRGTQYAVGAGVWVGEHEHSHFTFAVHHLGDTYLLDPWILFWQMYEDQKASGVAGNI